MSTSKYESVYILSPAHCATGGTEALVILCKTLREFGVDAYMYYVENYTGEDPVPDRFRGLGLPCAETVPDKESVIIVIPETNTEYVNRFHHAKRAIWWLSVDNYIGRISYFGPRTIWRWVCKECAKFRDFSDDSIVHFCQSYYAQDYVTARGARSTAFLMDYLGSEHLNPDFPLSGREDVVLYNPRKGSHFTSKLISAAGKSIMFVPLQGMTPRQVHEWCVKAKVYIDFGHHPGKDRFPREAAMAGCLVITSKRGSAKYYDDIPIPDVYKFEDVDTNIARILDQIVCCFANYQALLADFSHYREEIGKDKVRFQGQVQEIFM